MHPAQHQPLRRLKVLDFSTLLPGPLASLVLAEAGADVIKVERPGGGDDMRRFAPAWGEDSGCFALLNRGKRSMVANLKDPEERKAVLELVREADVLIEQFRPGVMDRLGLGYEATRALNRRLVYCSISGYGQDGPMAPVPGHDLNYLAQSGMLSLSRGSDGKPGLPPGLIADIGGGALPAIINILLALRTVEQTGEGCHLDVAMFDNIFAWQYTALALAFQGKQAVPGGELNTGGSPRYQVYTTADGRHVAAAPMEDHFWNNFCELIGLDAALRDDKRDPQASIAAVQALIGQRDASHWQQAFEGRDVCCNIVLSQQEALQSPQLEARALFAARTASAGASMPSLPVPLAPVFRPREGVREAPSYGLGESRPEFKTQGDESE